MTIQCGTETGGMRKEMSILCLEDSNEVITLMNFSTFFFVKMM